MAAFTVSAAIGDESVTLKFPGGDGPGKGKPRRDRDDRQDAPRPRKNDPGWRPFAALKMVDGKIVMDDDE